MTPSYTHNQLDLQDKSSSEFVRSRYRAQMYENVAGAQRQSAASHYLPSIDLNNGQMRNGMGALNQQALHNLQPPLTYPEPEPSMAVLTSAVDLQPTHYLQSNLATSIASPQHQQQQHGKPTSQSAGTQTSSAPSPTSSTSPLPPKKKFPCPHASKFGCPDTFTTSGHASRHGKKHTGEKSVICPTCKKAFTRKDNMKQHERTHRNVGVKNGQNSSATASPTSATQPEHAFQNTSTPNARDRSGRSEEEDGEGESPGLDALAAAANIR
ncbi:MAG: hypothetical protein LQ343_002819 [Gyalolechia ehrenbergii]|nr:MAG: hypothetical protein LQ343_002819 [Gyalolechia ehrenbergii]